MKEMVNGEKNVTEVGKRDQSNGQGRGKKNKNSSVGECNTGRSTE